jgi:hypothetical protein
MASRMRDVIGGQSLQFFREVLARAMLRVPGEVPELPVLDLMQDWLASPMRVQTFCGVGWCGYVVCGEIDIVWFSVV